MQISLARPNQYLTCRNISHHRDKCDTLKALFDVQFGLYKYRCAVMSLSDKKFSISFCWFPRLFYISISPQSASRKDSGDAKIDQRGVINLMDFGHTKSHCVEIDCGMLLKGRTARGLHLSSSISHSSWLGCLSLEPTFVVSSQNNGN